jgi:hypothetical protein
MIRLLMSYHFHKDTDLDEYLSQVGAPVDVFADSGAYSAYASGAEIDRREYSKWLERWDHFLHVKSNLDVIGNPAAGADNLAYLRAEGHEILPVFHVGEPFDLLRQLCDTAPYVALGGMVPYLAFGAANRNRPQVMRWMIKCHQIAAKTGTALHGFGCTGSLFLRDLPFYSVDSSSYLFARKRCLMYMWNDSKRTLQSFHFRDLASVRRYAHVLRRYGIEPGRVADPGFMVSGTENFDQDRIDITAASMRSFMAMERSLVARHNVPTPLAGDSVAVMPGTKVYFVCGSDRTIGLAPIQIVAREGLL